MAELLDYETQFRLWDTPMYGAVDIVNKDTQGPVFDLGIELELYTGPIFIKEQHVRVMASRAGMIDKTEYEELKEKYDRLVKYTDTLVEAKEIAARLRDIFDRTDSEPADTDGDSPVHAGDAPEADSGKPTGNNGTRGKSLKKSDGIFGDFV
jgi:hypothetical protein